VDVWNFAKADPNFPHDSTSDQFFDEARFETYRTLGFHTVLTVAEGFDGVGGIRGLCEAALRNVEAPPPAHLVSALGESPSVTG